MPFMRLLRPPAQSERPGSGYYCCIRRTWTTQGREQAPNTSNYAWLIKKPRFLRDHKEEKFRLRESSCMQRSGLWLAVAMPICSFLKAFVEAMRCNTTILPLAPRALIRRSFTDPIQLCGETLPIVTCRDRFTRNYAKLYCRLHRRGGFSCRVGNARCEFTVDHLHAGCPNPASSLRGDDRTRPKIRPTRPMCLLVTEDGERPWRIQLLIRDDPA
jgi:hypothetical protein